jgi:hypothetical protein
MMPNQIHETDVETIGQFQRETEGLTEAGRPEVVELADGDALR